MSAQYPKLRALNIRRVQQNGSTYLLLQDPLTMQDGSLLVPTQLGAVLALCDGQHSLLEIVELARSWYGLAIDPVQLHQLLSQLDQAYLLDNANFENAKAERLAAYRSAAYRPPACAGSVYPAQEAALQRYLQQQLQKSQQPPATQPILGFVSPHIDYHRGAAVYADVFRAAVPAIQSAELVIIFGTDHFGGQAPFTLTRQHFATPLGVLPTAQALVDVLAQALAATGSDAYAGELFHCGEHALELPLVWLHGLRPTNPPLILPILCGQLGSAANLSQHLQVQAVLHTLRPLLQEQRVLVLASGDLAHVGPAFDGEPLGPLEKSSLQRADRALLQHLQVGDALGFYQTIDRLQNRYNVCGWSAIYLAAALCQSTSAQLLCYQQCPADAVNTSLVSIAGILLS